MTPELLPVAQLTAMATQILEWFVMQWQRSFRKGFMIALIWSFFIYCTIAVLIVSDMDYGLVLCMVFTKFIGTFSS